METKAGGCSCEGCGRPESGAGTATLWGLYFSWAVERLEEAGSIRTLKKKVQFDL